MKNTVNKKFEAGVDTIMERWRLNLTEGLYQPGLRVLAAELKEFVGISRPKQTLDIIYTHIGMRFHTHLQESRVSPKDYAKLNTCFMIYLVLTFEKDNIKNVEDVDTPEKTYDIFGGMNMHEIAEYVKKESISGRYTSGLERDEWSTYFKTQFNSLYKYRRDLPVDITMENLSNRKALQEYFNTYRKEVCVCEIYYILTGLSGCCLYADRRPLWGNEMTLSQYASQPYLPCIADVILDYFNNEVDGYSAELDGRGIIGVTYHIE